MPRYELGGIRRSQAIGNHGPGAIIDFRGGGLKGAAVSVVAAGLEEWDERSRKPGLGNDQVIYEPRLQAKLGVEGFRLPPVTPEIRPGVPSRNADKLVGVRFPTWLQCPECHVLKQRWDYDEGEPALYCSPCSDKLPGSRRAYVVPVRFVVACANGHLDEFPWNNWVRHNEGCRNKSGLLLEAGDTAGLAGLMLSCRECAARQSMEGCFSFEALKGVGAAQCRGRRPWLRDNDPNPCTERPRVVQRGASNLYFPITQSALDIPPWSDPIQKRLEQHWATLKDLEDPNARRAYIDLVKLDKKFGMTLDALSAQVEERCRLLEAPTAASLRWEEYRQFVEHDTPFGTETEFEVRPQDVPPELRQLVSRISVATRLREVRVLTGFTRINPPGGETDTHAAPISGQNLSWLPAVEVRGEGIFVELSRSRLNEWEKQEAIMSQAAGLNDRYRQARLARGAPPDEIRVVTPRFLLVHSLAHALIRQLSLACGYSAASLRERLYVGVDEWDMAGLLIYTASTDADGTLGGLARQGHPDDLADTLRGALQSLVWCSSDPLCIAGKSSLSHQLNLAACHACMLVSETSCEEFNVLLDRTLLVGKPADRSLGFFGEFVLASANEGL